MEISEISHRVLNSYGDKIRGYKALHSVDKALDLDITNWTNINNFKSVFNEGHIYK